MLFLATANIMGDIPLALADRMETIDVPGYTRTEKLGIASQFLVPKQLREHGITEERLEFITEGLEHIVDFYTREAGVRGLERQIGQDRALDEKRMAWAMGETSLAAVEARIAAL